MNFPICFKFLSFSTWKSLKLKYNQIVKTIKVAAAVIEKDKKIMIARRAYGDQEGLWEFPGGKAEYNEKSEEAVVREIREEFDADIVVDAYLCTIEHDYDSFHLVMDCFLCHFEDFDLHLHDHTEIRWIDPYEEDVNWVPADVKVIEEYRKKKGTAMDRYEALLKKVRKFNEDRDWDQFHSPDNLAKSVCIEAGELLECFQWSDDYDTEAVGDEMADVFVYLLDLADRLQIDLIDIADKKMDKNAKKYPVEKSKGNSIKYDRF